MGVVTPRNLSQILFIAATHAEANDPPSEINNYIIVNGLLTPNVRTDSGQPDAWRDYQQILSELGLMFSTRVLRRIMPTPLGLAFLDGSFGFSEVITMQALRFQYPNGHHLDVSPPVRQVLDGTPFARARTFASLQHLSGVRLRPGVLVWRVVRGLQADGLDPELNTDEIECYLMRCATHEDTELCLRALIAARRGGATLPPLGAANERPRRNAQDWVKFLALTPLFDFAQNRRAIRLSAFGVESQAEIDALCSALERPESFWQPGALDNADRLAWYSYFGSIDLGVPPIPAPAGAEPSEEFAQGTEEEEPSEQLLSAGSGSVILRPFTAGDGDRERRPPRPGAAIESVYSAELADHAHRLHDQMVLLIARICLNKGADLYEDPNSVDLLANFRGTDFIIEVKSVTPKNFIARIRYALGQVFHYDYLRSLQSRTPRRKVLAFAAQLPPEFWGIPFLNTYLDTDLLSLEAGLLKTDSQSELSRDLFD